MKDIGESGEEAARRLEERLGPIPENFRRGIVERWKFLKRRQRTSARRHAKPPLLLEKPSRLWWLKGVRSSRTTR